MIVAYRRCAPSALTKTSGERQSVLLSEKRKQQLQLLLPCLLRSLGVDYVVAPSIAPSDTRNRWSVLMPGPRSNGAMKG